MDIKRNHSITITYLLLTIIVISTGCIKKETVTTVSSASGNGACSVGRWASTGTTGLDLKISNDIINSFNPSDTINGLNPIERMATVWNNAVGPNIVLFKVPMGTTNVSGDRPLASFYDNEFGVYFSNLWFPEVSSGALAITQFYGITRSSPTLGNYLELDHADIIINERDFHNMIVTNASASQYDLPTVILHEMGHFIGLCHETVNNSIMEPFYYGPRQTLTSFDINKIKALYLNNQNYTGALMAGGSANGSVSTASAGAAAIQALSIPKDTPVVGTVELLKNGTCAHYINGKKVFEHKSGPMYGRQWMHEFKVGTSLRF